MWMYEDIIIHHHHHHVVPPARISLTLFRNFSLSFVASGWPSGLHPVSSQSCCMHVRAGRPTFARPYMGVYIYIYISSPTLGYTPMNSHSSGLLGITLYWPICLAGRTLTNSPGDRGSITGRVILKTQKMVLNNFLLNTRIKCKMDQSRERSTALSYISVQ